MLYLEKELEHPGMSILKKSLRPVEVERRFGKEVLEKLYRGWQGKASFLFADLCGFTGMCEEEWAEDSGAVVAVLNEFYEMTGRIIVDEGGIVDKHIGDCVFAIFGGPFRQRCSQPVGVGKAAHAGLSMISCMQSVNWSDTVKQIPGLKLRLSVGVNTGRVFIGLVGSEEHVEGDFNRYDELTAIGRAVNHTQRCQAAANNDELVIPKRLWTSVSPQIESALGSISEDCICMKNVDKPVDVLRMKPKKLKLVFRKRV